MLDVLMVALGLGFVIFIHELGHFLLAKWNDVKVEKFSIGFGPTLFGFRRGETEYVLAAVPLGGFVKMLGEGHRRVLGDAVRHRVQRSEQAGGGRGVDQIAGAARQHFRHQVACREHMAHHMHAPAHIPIGIRGRLLSLARQPGIGEENIDRAEFGLGRRDERLDVFLETNIGGDR